MYVTAALSQHSCRNNTTTTTTVSFWGKKLFFFYFLPSTNPHATKDPPPHHICYTLSWAGLRMRFNRPRVDGTSTKGGDPHILMDDHRPSTCFSSFPSQGQLTPNEREREGMKETFSAHINQMVQGLLESRAEMETSDRESCLSGPPP